MKLKLNGIAVDCVIGERPDERVRLQSLNVDLELEIVDGVAVSDELGDTVDYAALSERVRACLVESKCRMIERAAYLVAQMVMGDDKVQRCVVSVTKLDSVPGMKSATAIYELTREEKV